MVDLTDDLLEFPCSFPLKAIGKTTSDLEALIYTVLCKHVSSLDKGCVTCRPSKKGKYLSVTVTFMAESKEQLEGIYQELSAHEDVLMVF